MPDLAMLEPRVLNGIISRLPPRDGFLGHSIVSRQSYPLPVWEYDVVTSRRNIARPNTPNSPAYIVDQNGIGKMQGSFQYTREKKVFEPTTLHWLRAPGQMAQSNAEAAVAREMDELVMRIDRLEEMLIWKMLVSGGWDMTALGQPYAIDYLVQATHKPTVSVFWTSPLADIVEDLTDAKRVVTRDSDVVLNTLIGNGPTISTFYRSTQVQGMLSNEQKGAYATTGVVPKINGITFQEYDRGYVDDFTVPGTPTFVPYVPDGYLVGIADGGWDTTFSLLDGPTADDEAPQGSTGRFSKTWKEKDPSQRQILIESNFMPVLYQPDRLMVLKVF